MRTFIAIIGLGLLISIALPHPTRADLGAGIKALEAKDYDAALKELMPLAEQGDVEAMFRIGDMRASGKGVKQRYKTAFKWYQKAAEKGHSEAQFRVGSSFYWGGGSIKEDRKLAVKWLRLSAAQGHSRAQYYLGRLYSDGEGGLEKNAGEAFKLYLMSAEQRNKYGLSYLGVSYLEGNGVEKDLVAALKWLTLGYLRGNSDHEKYLDEARRQMTWDQIQEASSQAGAWMKANK